MTKDVYRKILARDLRFEVDSHMLEQSGILDVRQTPKSKDVEAFDMVLTTLGHDSILRDRRPLDERVQTFADDIGADQHHYRYDRDTWVFLKDKSQTRPSVVLEGVDENGIATMRRINVQHPKL
jgi:hypothetical protein